LTLLTLEIDRKSDGRKLRKLRGQCTEILWRNIKPWAMGLGSHLWHSHLGISELLNRNVFSNPHSTAVIRTTTSQVPCTNYPRIVNFKEDISVHEIPLLEKVHRHKSIADQSIADQSIADQSIA
jgi:hypothetical protein